MLFNSLTFLFIFLPICLLLYFLLPGIKLKNTILLIFSLIFYSFGEPVYVLLMLFSIFISYIFGLLINNGRYKKFYLIISIILLLLNLFFFKYSNFLIDNINYIFNLNISNLNLSLPIGISFYTFQALSYLIDLYKGKIKVQKNFFYLALYISLFPQLIAGPIVRYETVEEEIRYRKSGLLNVVDGFKRFIIGLSKKVILANSMALISDTIYNSYSSYGTVILWLAAICYTLHIYYDFSGYSDMAIGLGKIFGFNFLENFNYPYIATSITDFWRRWHISLSSWFKDYVYIPLGGSRVCKYKHIRNILVVWFLTGLWHGASWNYIIWGLYFACFLLIEKYLLKDNIKKIPKYLRHIITMLIVIVSWVIFKIEDFNSLLNILKEMFLLKLDNFSTFFITNSNLFINFLILMPAIIFAIPIRKIKIEGYTYEFFINIGYILLLLIDVVFIVGSTYSPFIYFRF